jgi:CheY-like chemotaxis protein
MEVLNMAKKMLVADDSITIQKVIELTFTAEDFQVVTVGNGALAIEKINKWRPDIILLDVVMPEKNGYEVCEIIKSNPNYMTIPVILVVGTFEPFDQERAKHAGMDDFITKPFESNALIKMVNRLLEKYGPREEKKAAPPAQPKPAEAPKPMEFADRASKDASAAEFKDREQKTQKYVFPFGAQASQPPAGPVFAEPAAKSQQSSVFDEEPVKTEEFPPSSMLSSELPWEEPAGKGKGRDIFTDRDTEEALFGKEEEKEETPFSGEPAEGPILGTHESPPVESIASESKEEAFFAATASPLPEEPFGPSPEEEGEILGPAPVLPDETPSPQEKQELFAPEGPAEPLGTPEPAEAFETLHDSEAEPLADTSPGPEPPATVEASAEPLESAEPPIAARPFADIPAEPEPPPAEEPLAEPLPVQEQAAESRIETGAHPEAETQAPPQEMPLQAAESAGEVVDQGEAEGEHLEKDEEISSAELALEDFPEEILDAIVNRVLQKLKQSIVREELEKIVPGIAEEIIRKKLEELENLDNS